jgi:hypothetical protein
LHPIEFKNGCQRSFEVKVIHEVCWYTAAGSVPVQIVLVRNPKGKWRDEALVSTDLSLSAQEMITGYCRRWSVEVAFCDAKQMLGFHDPMWDRVFGIETILLATVFVAYHKHNTA